MSQFMESITGSRFGRRAIVALVLAPLGFGYIWWKRQGAEKDLRAYVATACGSDTVCDKAVAEHLSSCIAEAKEALPSNTDASSAMQPLVIACVNRKAGKPVLR
jgi:hypothetical protein